MGAIATRGAPPAPPQQQQKITESQINKTQVNRTARANVSALRSSGLDQKVYWFSRGQKDVPEKERAEWAVGSAEGDGDTQLGLATSVYL